MEVLIIEDNANKLKQIKEFFYEYYPDWSLTESHSFKDGILKVYEQKWRLIILDMTLPTYELNYNENCEDLLAVAGKNIMKRMINKKIYIPVIIITQFEKFDNDRVTLESLNQEFERDFEGIWKGTVFYENDDWRISLKKLIEAQNI